jgi:hypothetical protein
MLNAGGKILSSAAVERRKDDRYAKSSEICARLKVF